MSNDTHDQNNVWELFKLDGKVALVTGSARNFGYQMAEALAEAGADVIITSRKLESAEKSAEKLHAKCGTKIVPAQLDVTDEDSIRALFDLVKTEFGKLDILVNNAGNTDSRIKSAELTCQTLENWQYVFDSNMTGTFLCTRYAVEMMQEACSGKIINIASMSGIIGRDRRIYDGLDMIPNVAEYSASKGAMIAFTRDVAAEMGKYNIHVNAISPGGFERAERQPKEFVRRYSEQTILGRMGTDGKDLKGAIVYLASEASDYVTGHNLIVDGGFSVW